MNGNKQIILPIKTLLPYLIIKKRQAMLIVEFIERSGWYAYRKGNKRGTKQLPESEIRLREDFYLKIKKLNAVGAAATK